MSSILDALNKLEKEKVRAKKKAAREQDVDIETAARDLVGRSLLRDRFTLQLSPAMLLTVVVAASLILVISGVGASWAYFRPDPPAAVASANTNPTDTPSGSAVVPPLALAPEEQTSPPEQPTIQEEVPPPPELDPEPTPPVLTEEPVTNASEDTTKSQPIDPEPLVVPTEKQTDPVVTETPSVESPLEDPEPLVEEVVVARETVQATVRAESQSDSVPVKAVVPTVPVAPVPRVEPPAAPAEPVFTEPKPIDYLPAFSPAVRERYEIPKLRVNHIHLGDSIKPRPFAWINNIPVYVGEKIQGSKARLKKVAEGGVAIEIIGTKEQYFLKF